MEQLQRWIDFKQLLNCHQTLCALRLPSKNKTKHNRMSKLHTFSPSYHTYISHFMCFFAVSLSSHSFLIHSILFYTFSCQDTCTFNRNYNFKRGSFFALLLPSWKIQQGIVFFSGFKGIKYSRSIPLV